MRGGGGCSSRSDTRITAEHERSGICQQGCGSGDVSFDTTSVLDAGEGALLVFGDERCLGGKIWRRAGDEIEVTADL